MIGQKLNNSYIIVSLLGEGAMGEVYLARDEQTGQQVAVKILARKLITHPDLIERFRREAVTLRQLDHPNIVKFIDTFEHEGQYIIMMEYLTGGSLHDLIKKGPLPIEHAVQIGLDLCDALIRSHRLKIIHRDIKPENILFDKDGTPKLADFGVARLSEGTRMTRSGVQVGTPYYMSPEAWDGRTLDAQADIWSLGVVLFEMLAGQVPFGGDTPLAVMSKINTTPPPDLKKLRSEVPLSLVRIVSRMLTRNKQRRYQTVREVAVDLERGLQMIAPRALTPRVAIYEQIAERIATLKKSSNTILSTSKSKLTRLVLALKSAVVKIPPNVRFGGMIGLIILIIAIVFFPSLQRLLDSPVTSPGSIFPLAAAPMDGLVVFSTSTSESEIKFYLYDVTTNNFSIIDVGGGTNWDPVLSSSGNMYFTSNRDGKAEIYRRFPDGRIERVTHTDGESQSWGAVTSIGGNIYFTSNREENKAEIYRARLVNGSWIYERVTYTDGDFESWGAAPSPGGNLYFTSNREDNKAEIYRTKINETGGPERVTYTDGDFESWGAAPSPGGNLYFTSNREDNKAEIYRTEINGTGGPERITHTDGEFQSWGPIFYGLSIYFTSNRSTKYEVYLHIPSNAPKNVLGIESWTNYSDATNLDEKSPIFPLP